MILNYRDKTGKSPAFIAAEYKQTDLLMALIEWGADLNIESHVGWRILHQIVNSDNVDLLKAFFANPKVAEIKMSLLAHRDNSSRTAMHIAAYKGSETIVQIMLANGADAPRANTLDTGGNTPAQLAAKSGRRKSKELMNLAGCQ